MLKIILKDKTYEVPLLSGDVGNKIALREAEFDIDLIFKVPTALISRLYQENNIIQTDDNPIILLNLEINHYEYDPMAGKMHPIGNLSLQPNAQELENMALSEKIVQESTLFFPGYAQRAKLKCISFGKLTDHHIDVAFSGSCTDIYGTLDFEVRATKIPIL